MSIVDLVRQPQGNAGTSSTSPERAAGSPSLVQPFEGAARALLEDLWSGRLTATTPADRWLVARMEEALEGVAEIRELAAADHPESPPDGEISAPKASILAPRAGAGN